MQIGIVEKAQNFQKNSLASCAIYLCLTGFVFLFLSCFRECFIDDAMMVFQFAKTLCNHGVWGYFPSQIVNTTTSPLNVSLTALFGMFSPSIPTGALMLASVEASVMAMFLVRTSRLVWGSPFWGVLSFVALVANPLLLSTLGLESMLFASLLCACLYYFVAGRWRVLAFFLALLTLTRPDGILLFGVMFLLFNFAGLKSYSGTKIFLKSVVVLSKERVMFVLFFSACLAPWYIFSWIFLGSALPETFFIKAVSQGGWNADISTINYGMWTFKNGLLLFFVRYPLEIFFSFLLAPFALSLLFITKEKSFGLIIVLFGFAVFFSSAYSLMNVAPYHWYFIPTLVPVVLLGSAGVTTLLQYKKESTGEKALLLSGLFVLLPFLGISLFFINEGSIAPSNVPIHTNWATHTMYKKAGLWLKENIPSNQKIKIVVVEPGTLQFYSDLEMLDYFSSREMFIEQILNNDDGENLFTSLLKKANFFWAKPGQPMGDFSYLIEYRETYPVAIKSVVKSWPIHSRWKSPRWLVLHKVGA